ncbi:unnamed protein product [Pieris brassicae]|uniref:Uncharacterized protein n=1 Tax=Pieris brassicae TaxID=7116 RepID=A0A9P0TZQ5_PIEBR|nr:unnamed protein product [Pieris brassicae]
MANALVNLTIKHKITITHKFLERGHTQMECDSVHSAIGRKLSNRVIHLPCDYVSVTKEARASNPYEVIQIDHSFVNNYADTSTWLYKTIRPGRKAGDPTICDYDMKIINVNSKFGGATHDSHICSASHVETYMQGLYENGEHVWLFGSEDHSVQDSTSTNDNRNALIRAMAMRNALVSRI